MWNFGEVPITRVELWVLFFPRKDCLESVSVKACNSVPCRHPLAMRRHFLVYWLQWIEVGLKLELGE
jgi:hypothetical protein